MNYEKSAFDKLGAAIATKNNVENAIAEPTRMALISFCEQDAEFAQAVAQSEKTFEDCLKEIAKGVGRAISDIEVYKRAARFWFPGAEVDFTMTIRVNPYDSPVKSKSAISLSLDDLFDD
jgi:hypothetical protein